MTSLNDAWWRKAIYKLNYVKQRICRLDWKWFSQKRFGSYCYVFHWKRIDSYSESARLLHLGHIARTCLWRKAWTVCKPQRSSECYQRQMAWCWWLDNGKSHFVVEKAFSNSGKAKRKAYSTHFLLVSRLMTTVTFWCSLRTSDNMNDELLANIVLLHLTLFHLYHG